MEVENQNLIEISSKLEITDKKIINKASEHLRLLKVKSNSLQINEYAKIVICLDVAASDTNPLNTETALSLLSYGKAKYRKEKNIIQRILNVTRLPDVKSICLSVRVANNKELQENALRILKEYKENKTLTESHPQYDAMAVYQTSKMMKIKISEDKLIEESHLKRSQWTTLKIHWNRWLEDNKVNLKSNSKKNTDDDVSEAINDTKENIKPTIIKEEVEESYEDWKSRILAKAYTDLKLRNTDQN